MKCPKCRSEVVREVKQKSVSGAVLRTIGYKSYKCQVCGEKFRAFGEA